MIQLNIERDEFLKPLQMVSHVPAKHQTLPILSHILFTVSEGKLALKGTDLEIAIESEIPLKQGALTERKMTLPGRKLLDICRNLPAESTIEFIEEEKRCIVRSGGSQFSLATLPAHDFPSFNEGVERYTTLTIRQKDLLRLIQSTAFAIAQKDIRYYLNGMLLKVLEDRLTFVATDGHRLALNQLEGPTHIEQNAAVIMPRKGVIELTRLLSNQAEDSEITLLISAQHIVVKGAQFNFISRLIEGQFPQYEQVIPQQADKRFKIDKTLLKQALTRVSILSNERLPGVLMQLRKNSLNLIAKNPDKEEAREEIAVDYTQEDINVSFNAAYLIDVLNVVHSDTVELALLNSSSAFLVKEGDEDPKWLNVYVIMPMRL